MEIKIARNTTGNYIERKDETFFNFLKFITDCFKEILEDKDSQDDCSYNHPSATLSFSVPSFSFSEKEKGFISKEKFISKTWPVSETEKTHELTDKIYEDSNLSLLFELTEKKGIVYNETGVAGYIIPDNYFDNVKHTPDRDVPTVQVYYQNPKDLIFGVGESYLSICFNPIQIFADKNEANFSIDLCLYRSSVDGKNFNARTERLRPALNYNPNPTTTWDENLKAELWSSITEWINNNLPKKKEEAIEILSPKQSPYFAVPSHSIMITLIALFTGKPDKIPRRQLEKPEGERTLEEQKEAEDYIKSLIEETSTYEEGKEIITKYAVFSDTPIVTGKAELSQGNLFKDKYEVLEEGLALHIKKAYGAEGLRHLLGYCIALEENFREGSFIFDLNEHLGRLGYTKKKGETYDKGLKERATEIFKILTHVRIVAQRKDNNKLNIAWTNLFMIEGGKEEIDLLTKDVINRKIKVHTTEFWYGKRFQTTDGQAPQYTKLLKSIVKENHRERKNTILLGTLLSIFWRIGGGERKLSVLSLFKWCDLDASPNNSHRMKELRDLMSELDYMKGKGYLGEWINNGEAINPADCKDPFSCILTLNPPEWLEKEIKRIEAKRERLITPPKTLPEITRDTIIKILKEKNLSQKQLANHLGVTRQLINYVVNGQKPLTKALSKAMYEKFKDIL